MLTMVRRWGLEQTQLIPKPRHEVFAFFANAQNLQRLTPGFLGFEIITPAPIEMQTGAIIDYSLRFYGVSVVSYELPFGPLGTLARSLFVRGSFERIFNYRRKAVTSIFGPVPVPRIPTSGAPIPRGACGSLRGSS